jgi:hypothetical protein
MAQFYKCFIKNFAFIMAPITKLVKKTEPFYLDQKVSKNLGLDQVETYGNTNFDTSKLVATIPCAHKCIFTSSRCIVSTKPNWKV